MSDHEQGKRVALAHTSNPNGPRPGRQGIVRAYDPDLQIVTVAWDDGRIGEVRLADGDRLDILPSPPISETAWRQVLATVSARGARDGRRAIEQWIIEHGDPATQQARNTARQVLQSLREDHDLDEPLPQYTTSSFADPPGYDSLADLLAGIDPARPRPVAPFGWWEQAGWQYHDQFDSVVRDRAGDWARRVLLPAADGRDLAELSRDDIRVGRVGVFSGEWMWQYPDQGPDYLRVGFVGTLIDWWNGWAVFCCTRQVADGIVAEQQQIRAHEQSLLEQGGMSPAVALREVNNTLADLWFDGEVIVADQRGMYDDDEAIQRIAPDSDGRYVVMGYDWCWEAVDPYACDRIVGELPAPEAEQEFVLLTHTPGLRMPHDRLRLDLRQDWPVDEAPAWVGTLMLDGRPIGTASNPGGGADLVLTDPNAREAVLDFVARCRYHGGPVSRARLLDALADQSHLDAALARVAGSGGTLVRAVDDAGYTRTLRPLAQQPTSWNELTRLGDGLDHAIEGYWEIWTGRSWLILPGTSRPSA